jgi:hypothetical protein
MICPSVFRSLGALLGCSLLALGALSPAQQARPVFRVTAIPAESLTELARNAGPLMKYLQGKLEMTVACTPVTDCAATVEALVSKEVEIAWRWHCRPAVCMRATGLRSARPRGGCSVPCARCPSWCGPTGCASPPPNGARRLRTR